MANRSKAKGTAFESDVAGYLRRHTPLDVERRTLGGVNDRGDLSGVFLGGERVVVECKATKRMDLAGHWGETQREAEVDGAAYGFLVVKRPGCGSKNVGRSYVVMDLEQLARILDRFAGGAGNEGA